MGATYTRQSSYTDGGVITAAHTNDEFNQLLAAFAASTGHTHNGDAGEGGPITKLLGNNLTFGTATADTDVLITFDGEERDGLLRWIGHDASGSEDDHFRFDDDVMHNSDENLYFRDTAIHINSSTDGQLDLVADGAVVVDTAGDITLDADGGDILFKDGGVTFGSATNSSGNLIIKSGTTTALTFSGASVTVADTLTYGSLSDGAITITAFVDEDDMSSNSATLVPTQQSVKAYVDNQLTAEDLDFQADSGGALSIDLDSETLTFTGGTGIDTSGSGNTVTFAIDSTVATLTGSQTLTNKTLTTPIANAGVQLKNGSTSAGFLEFFEDSDNGTNKVTLIGPASTGDVTLTLPSATDTLVGKATTDTLTNKTIDVDNNTVSNIEVDNFKASAIVLESEGIGSNDNDTTIPTSAAVKDYVDTQITAEDLDFQADSGGALSIDLDSETLTFTGGTGIDTSGSGNAVTFAIDSTVATLTGSQTLTNKTLTTPIANAGIQLKNGATSAGFLEFFEDSDNGTNKVTLIGPASTADVTLTLPSATDTIVGKATTDTLTNKSIDSDNNTITNIVNADIKSSAAIADTKLDTISTANKVALTALDIDGATDIGEAVADADLFIIDNGAGGTNRKVTASALKTYAGGSSATKGFATAMAIAL